MNAQGKLGIKQAMRTRGLTASYYDAQSKLWKMLNRRLKAQRNKSFGKVATSTNSRYGTTKTCLPERRFNIDVRYGKH